MTRRALLSLGFASVTLKGQARRMAVYPPLMPGVSREEVYKQADSTVLRLYLYLPAEPAPANGWPAIVFFFGGGWRSGTPRQFAPHCQYFAWRGMVAAAADYRVWQRHRATIATCVEDAKSAVRWLRAHAQQLAIDPQRIVASGGSAGGHLAAATALLPGFEALGEDLSVSSAPNALVLFNPALILAPVPGKWQPAGVLAQLAQRAGAELKRLSPYHHIRRGLPPTIIFHGKADITVPYKTAELFCERMRAAGNRCELVGYENAGHGFFNYRPDNPEAFYDTLRRADRFLTSLGYLSGKPTVERFVFRESL